MVLIAQGHPGGPSTHFKGLHPLLLFDVFYALATLLLEVLLLLFIQQANFIQECRIPSYNLVTEVIHMSASERRWGALCFKKQHLTYEFLLGLVNPDYYTHRHIQEQSHTSRTI